MNCGTLKGWQQHKARNEPPCKWCVKAVTAPAPVVVAKPKRAATRKPATTPREPSIPGPTTCGTYSGYTRHKHLKEEACRPCKDASAAYQRAKYVPSTRVLVQCGTHAGRRKHVRDKTPICAPCEAAPKPSKKAK